MLTQYTTRTMRAKQVHGCAKIKHYLGSHWRMVSIEENFVNSQNCLWVSLGESSDREILLFNTSSSKILQLKKLALKRCNQKNIVTILQQVSEIINELSDEPNQSRRVLNSSIEARLNTFLKKCVKKNPYSGLQITMDSFIDEKLLVCRHKGLLAACIIAHLVENKILPEGYVRQYRSDFMDSAHTWSIYYNKIKKEVWLCDPQWEQVFNVTREKKINSALYQKGFGYGKEIIDIMLKRLECFEDNDKNQSIDTLINKFDKLALYKKGLELQIACKQDETLRALYLIENFRESFDAFDVKHSFFYAAKNGNSTIVSAILRKTKYINESEKIRVLLQARLNRITQVENAILKAWGITGDNVSQFFSAAVKKGLYNVVGALLIEALSYIPLPVIEEELIFAAKTNKCYTLEKILIHCDNISSTCKGMALVFSTDAKIVQKLLFLAGQEITINYKVMTLMTAIRINNLEMVRNIIFHTDSSFSKMHLLLALEYAKNLEHKKFTSLVAEQLNLTSAPVNRRKRF